MARRPREAESESRSGAKAEAGFISEPLPTGKVSMQYS